MTDFLLELRSEEIPARMQAKARGDLEALFVAQISAAGLAATRITVYSTPRRLALIAHGLPMETLAVSEEIKGPKISAPPQALEGFLRKTGLTKDQLVERDGIYFAVTEKPGRQAADVLAGAIPAIIRAFPWPKSMRWGRASIRTESLKWVRPLSGIIALFGDKIIPARVALSYGASVIEGALVIDLEKRIELVSGSTTMGHRFHHSGEITITNAADYAAKLRAAHVIVDHTERQDIVRAGAAKAAADAGLTLVDDEGLVIENAGLTEWPVPLLGRFDPGFLDVPQEVIQLTTRVNQKYFVCRDADGNLANAFVCTANIDAHDGGAAIARGNEKVLAARLSDAKFFWELDQKTLLADHAKKLKRITFHEKLGTVADKVERVAKLARWLVEQGIVKSSSSLLGKDLVDLANLAETAARLCKADLVTEMVGEFPELQGIMGGYYAAREGLPIEVSDAIRDHYKPVGQGDDVPTAPVTVAVSLADKLDTLVGFLSYELSPTGSKDPFALRRAANGFLLLIIENNISLPIFQMLAVSEWEKGSLARRNIDRQIAKQDFLKISSKSGADRFYRVFSDDDVQFFLEHKEAEKLNIEFKEPRIQNKNYISHIHNTMRYMRLFDLYTTGSKFLDFLTDRLKVQQREAGVRHDLIDAVFALGGEDDLVRLLARVKALQAFVTTSEGANLLAGYKRAANILKSPPERASAPEKSSPERGGGPAQLVEGSLSAKPAPSVSPDGLPPPRSGEELALQSALTIAEPLAAAALKAEDFAAAMTALASLRAPIDAFFEGVMVNDPDPDKRRFRIGLLTRFRDAVHTVADFSKIEG